MIRTQVYIPDDLYKDLMLIAETRQEKVSHLIRQGVIKVIEEKKRTKKDDGWKAFVGAWKSGPKDVSTKINDIYK